MPDDLKSLVKNPLGIIALFIALIYGFAALLLGVAAGQLMSEERQPLIWFIVLFPMVVLGTFYVLVTRHHGKLYAPKDYQNDSSFLRTLTTSEKEAKLSKELETADKLDSLGRKEYSLSVDNSVLKHTSTEVSFSNNPSQNTTLSTLRFKYKKSERLVISRIEDELSIAFQKDVTLKALEAFDGVYIDEKRFLAIEVKYIRAINQASYHLGYYLGLCKSIPKILEGKNSYKLILAFVLENSGNSNELKKELEYKAADDFLDIPNFEFDIRFYNFDELSNDD